jgi:hypothetical protein
MQARCGAHCRTTGKPCLNFPMPNGRCRMHGGKSPGRPQTSGAYAAQASVERQEMNSLLKEVNMLLKSIR